MLEAVEEIVEMLEPALLPMWTCWAAMVRQAGAASSPTPPSAAPSASSAWRARTSTRTRPLAIEVAGRLQLSLPDCLTLLRAGLKWQHAWEASEEIT